MNIPSGKFVIRLQPLLHKELVATAKKRGISLNQFCVSILSTYYSKTEEDVVSKLCQQAVEEQMKSNGLAMDYITRSGHRLAAVEKLMELKNYADVVCESQELIELSLKGLLRAFNVEVPRLHDVSNVLKQSSEKFPSEIKANLDQIAKISKKFCRDPEFAFYGTEDLTPSEFYKEEDAKEALDDARWIYSLCKAATGF